MIIAMGVSDLLEKQHFLLSRLFNLDPKRKRERERKRYIFEIVGEGNTIRGKY